MRWRSAASYWSCQARVTSSKVRPMVVVAASVDEAAGETRRRAIGRVGVEVVEEEHRRATAGGASGGGAPRA